MKTKILYLLVFAPAMLFAAPPGGHLNVTEVLVDDPNNPTSIMIVGEHFLFGPSGPTVTLGEFGPLAIVGIPTDTFIQATLPAMISAGDYLLTVSAGKGQSQNDEYDLTIGAVGPQGEQGDPAAVELDVITVSIARFGQGNVDCPAGYSVTGGGFAGAVGPGNVVTSQPLNNGWFVGLSLDRIFAVYAVCARLIPAP